MPFFRKKNDPIAARSRALNAQLAAVEATIKTLSDKVEVNPPPRIHLGARPSQNNPFTEPVFEEVHHGSLGNPEHPRPVSGREVVIPRPPIGLWRKFVNQFKPPATANPRLVNYLAAGSIQGLRPLRYEKRVARNRFILLVVCLFLLLFGIVTFFWRN